MSQQLLVFLTALAPLPPILAFAVISLFTNRFRRLSVLIAMLSMVLSLIISWTVFFAAIQIPDLAHNPIQGSVPWLPMGVQTLAIGVFVNPLGATFLFMVPLACTLIFLYSTEYMSHDPRQARFFAYLSLFAGSMMGFVVSDNLLTLFIFWELMGFCSYSLIGFFYFKKSAYRASVKAFMTTRVGDMLLLLGMVYLFTQTGTLNFTAVLQNKELLEELAHQPAVIFSGLSAAGLIGLLIFGGTVGKSAQWPLHVWLPDAMEGPTPVSAMIHAATMVSAGIFLLLRFFNLFHVTGEGSTPFLIVGMIGAFTAFMGATIAVAQHDVKRVLAFSTISQLGFMVAAVGVGAYVAAAFHLLTHAFFKALLFLGSGSVIHGVEHGHQHVTGHHAHGDPAREGLDDDHGHGHAAGAEHDAPHEEFDPQDMRNMGGLRKRMPITFWTFLIGGLALAGFPFITAGFWSKDEIFADAFHQGFAVGRPFAIVIFLMLAFSAFLTAFYTIRQIILVFLGKPRTEAAAHASENGWRMTVPLIALAFFGIFAGYVNVAKDFPLIGQMLGPGASLLKHFISPLMVEEVEALSFHIAPLFTSLLVVGLGLALGYAFYGPTALADARRDPLESMGRLFKFLQNRWYWDELYRKIFINPLQWIADNYSRAVDKGIIDRILEGGYKFGGMVADGFKTFDRVVVTGFSDTVGRVTNRAGRELRELQTGQVQNYLLSALIAAVVLLVFFMFFFLQ